MKRLAVALAWLTVLGILPPRAALAQAGPKAQLPEGAKITVAPRKEKYFLGENILLDFTVANTGAKPFNVDFGGDYRGSTRHLRFKVVATDARGNRVEDPDPDGFCMGGLGSAPQVAPEKLRTILRYSVRRK